MRPPDPAAVPRADRALRPAGARRGVVLLLLLCHVAGSVWLGWSHWRGPLGNWDIVPYTALALAEPGRDPARLTEATHAALRGYLSQPLYQAVVGASRPDDTYLAAMRDSPDAFADNLRFYAIKPLYVTLVRAATRLGANPAAAAVAVSAVALALFMIVFPFGFRFALPAAAGLWLLLFAGAPPLHAVGAIASPDALALLLTVPAAWCMVRGAAWLPTAVLALLAVLARPDTAFLLGPLLAGLAWQGRHEARDRSIGRLVLMAAMAGLFLVLGLKALPWATLFHHSFIERLNHPSAWHGAVSVAEYLAVVERTLPGVLTPRLLSALFGAVLLCCGRAASEPGLVTVRWLVAAAVLNILLHHAVFPADEFGHERLFLPSYLLLWAAALIRFEAWRGGSGSGMDLGLGTGTGAGAGASKRADPPHRGPRPDRTQPPA